jgi:hypothetical protein
MFYKRLRDKIGRILLLTMTLCAFILNQKVLGEEGKNRYQVESYKTINHKSPNLKPENINLSTLVPGSFSIEKNPYRYSVYYSDSESDMFYCQARYYSPEIMRFINRDT